MPNGTYGGVRGGLNSTYSILLDYAVDYQSLLLSVSGISSSLPLKGELVVMMSSEDSSKISIVNAS